MAITWPEITENAWTKIATNVTNGKIDRLNSSFTCWITSVATGATAPEATIKDRSPKIFEESNEEEINSSVAIDIYIWIENADDSENTETENIIQVTI